MVYETFSDLITAYLDTLRGRPSHTNMRWVAAQWIRTLTATPRRSDILARHQLMGHGHFQKGASQANTEIALMRAACRWGIYQEKWSGGDPTVGIRKWKTPKRTRISKFEEIRKLLGYFARAQSPMEIRDRALYGLMLCTGCRPSEARTAKLDAITPYGDMGAWVKGKTKNGENQELPLPKQLMPWIEAWTAIRPTTRPSLYLFPGQTFQHPITAAMVRMRWMELRALLGITGLWNYDLRRTLVCTMGNELNYSDQKIKAIINHNETSALGRYYFVSFDALTGPIQHYADWLWALMAPTATQLRRPETSCIVCEPHLERSPS